MSGFLTGLLIGLIAAGAAAFAVWRARRRSRASAGDPDVKTFLTIEQLRSIGELSVFKVITKEIQTAKDHWLGDWGKKYLEWLTTSKKMAMIFEFDIDFRYDLRDSEFRIEEESDPGCYRIVMPRCKYEIHIRDITFYDEQRARFLPWLIPDLLTSVFGSGFNEEDRNRLKEEARRQAESLARGLVQRLRSEVQSSARETMTTVARAFSARRVEVEFRDREPEQMAVAFTEAAEAAEAG
jgi:hypothetical protein